MRKLIAGIVSSALLAGPAVAQDSGWTYNISMNLWMTDTSVTADTPHGTVDAELSFSDAIKDLDFAFMGTVEARNGPWGLIGDLDYFNLTADGPSPAGLAYSEVAVGNKITLLSGYLAYRVHQDDRIAVDLGAGFRAFWTEMDTTFVGASAPTLALEQSKNWVDPVVAARVRLAFNDQWFGTVMLDVGGTGDTSTWQALATVGYRFNERWLVQGGYRYIEAEWDTDDGQSSLAFSGPILGVTYSF